MFTRIKCWWNGHNITKSNYEGTEYICRLCEKTGKYKDFDEVGFSYRHETITNVLKALGIITVVIVAFLVVIHVAGIIMSPIFYMDCRTSASIMDLPFKWDFWSGCFYQVDGTWVRDDLLNAVKLIGK